MTHWILTSDRLQTMVTLLDSGRMTLKAAKTYFSAYGVEVRGQTKNQFIKNLAAMVRDNEGGAS